MMKVVEVLAEKYGFNLEEAMSSLKSVKSVKKAKKVEVSDIFAEMTREGDGVVEVVVVKEKKPRTSAQLIAFEKMRVKRAEKLAEKELEKEKLKLEVGEEEVGAPKEVKEKKEKVVKEKKEKVVKAPKEKVVKAPKEKVVKEKKEKEVKEKKPRSEAQLAAFEKMKQAKADKKALKELEGKVEVVSEVVSEVEEEVSIVSVVKFIHEGVKYLKSSNNTLYNAETEEAVGMWDEITGKIIEMELTEEEEIDE